MFWIILFFVAVDYPLFKIFYNWLFPEPEDLTESLHYALTPGIVSFFRGEFRQGLVSAGRLWFFVFLCAGPVAFEVTIIVRLFHLQ